MEKNRQKSLVGRVVSNKMDKTVVVAVESRKPHPLYKKILKRQVKLKAHDENNACQVGDVVTIMGSRPLSKTKHWRVVGIVSKGEVAEIQPDDSVLQ